MVSWTPVDAAPVLHCYGQASVTDSDDEVNFRVLPALRLVRYVQSAYAGGGRTKCALGNAAGGGAVVTAFEMRYHEIR